MWRTKLGTILTISAVALAGFSIAAYSAATTQPSGTTHARSWHHHDGQWGTRDMTQCHGQCRSQGMMNSRGTPMKGMMMAPGSTMRTLMSALLGEHDGMQEGSRMHPHPHMQPHGTAKHEQTGSRSADHSTMSHPMMQGRMMQGRMMDEHHMGMGSQSTHHDEHGWPSRDDDHSQWEHHEEHHAHGMMNSRMQRMMMGQFGRTLVLRSQLNLTRDQQSRIRGFVKEGFASVAKAMHSVMAKRTELQTLSLTGGDDKAIDKAAADLGSAMADAAKAQSAVMARIRSVLTDDQAAAVDAFVKGSAKAKLDFMKQMAGKFEKKASTGSSEKAANP